MGVQSCNDLATYSPTMDATESLKSDRRAEFVRRWCASVARRVTKNCLLCWRPTCYLAREALPTNPGKEADQPKRSTMGRNPFDIEHVFGFPYSLCLYRPEGRAGAGRDMHSQYDMCSSSGGKQRRIRKSLLGKRKISQAYASSEL